MSLGRGVTCYFLCRLRNISGSKFNEELNDLLARGVNGKCTEKVRPHPSPPPPPP